MPSETPIAQDEWTITRIFTLQEQICECIDKLGTLLTMHIKNTEALATSNNRVLELERTTDSLMLHNNALTARIETLELKADLTL